MTILVAGFIARFGKKTADYRIGRFRRRQGPDAAGLPDDRVCAPPVAPFVRGFKKLVKVRVKQQKKTGLTFRHVSGYVKQPYCL